MSRDSDDEGDAAARDARAVWVSTLPFTLLVLALAAAFAAGAETWLSVSAYTAGQDRLVAWVAEAPLAAAAAFTAICLVCAAISLPAGALLGVIGGALFGAWLGPALYLAGTTGGSLVLFLAARPPLRRIAMHRSGEGGQRVLAWMRAHAIATALALRLAPIVPGPVPALVLAAAGAPAPSFAAGTALGLLPAAMIFGWSGATGHDTLVMRAGDGVAPIWPVDLALALAGVAVIVLAVRLGRPRR